MLIARCFKPIRPTRGSLIEKKSMRPGTAAPRPPITPATMEYQAIVLQVVILARGNEDSFWPIAALVFLGFAFAEATGLIGFAVAMLGVPANMSSTKVRLEAGSSLWFALGLLVVLLLSAAPLVFYVRYVRTLPGSLVTGLAREEVARWVPGSEFRALDRMNALTLEIILRVVFGVTDESRLAELRPRVNKTVDISPAILLGWGYPWLQKIGPWKRTVQNQHELDGLIYAEIRERRRAPDLAERTDVLSRLMLATDGEGPGDGDGLTDTELRDQLVTLLLAGHETTATALAWALHEIGRDPEQLCRAREAALSGDDAWLDAVMKESMRLHPVIPMVVRTLTKPATVGGIDLPAGATIGPSIIVAHSREENHPEPDVFRPERFLEQNPPTNTWIPFGGGVRRCIGAGFSLMEGVAVLREVLTAYDVTALGADEPKVRNITSVPRRGARIRVTAR